MLKPTGRCAQYRHLVHQYFAFLFEAYGYAIIYHERFGRHDSSCLFGASAEDRMRFQFRRELSPYIWIGLPNTPFGDETTVNGTQ